MAENSADIAKRIILNCIAEGMTVEQGCASAGKSIKTYEYYRRTDKVFADKMDRTRLGLRDKSFASGDTRDLTFAEFRQRFLHNATFPHQQNLVDVIEGKNYKTISQAEQAAIKAAAPIIGKAKAKAAVGIVIAGGAGYKAGKESKPKNK